MTRIRLGPLPCGHDESEAWFSATRRAITPLKPPGACGAPSMQFISFPNRFGCFTGNGTIHSTKRIPVSGGESRHSHKEPIFGRFDPATGWKKGLVTIKGRWVSSTRVKGTTTVKKGECKATTKWTMVKVPVL